MATVNRDERIVRPTLDLETIELVTDFKLRFTIFDDPAIVMKVPLKGHAEIVLACPSLETLNWWEYRRACLSQIQKAARRKP